MTPPSRARVVKGRPAPGGRGRAMPTARTCLSCARAFRSASIANRLCKACIARAKALGDGIAG